VYDLGSEKLALAIEMLLAHRCLVLQDDDAVARSLESFRARPSLGFSECLMVELARRAGHLPMGTFDRALAKIAGAQQL
jgi:predicted nucleic-acid-binding protein